jgi:hypothetical protein
MVTTIVVVNLFIALLCLYAARKIWRVGKILASVADTLTVAERNTHAVLGNAPEQIIRGQLTMHQLRQQYQRLESQLQRAQQVLALTGLSQWVWLWYTRRRSSGPLRHPRRPSRWQTSSLDRKK